MRSYRRRLVYVISRFFSGVCVRPAEDFDASA
jgi:hypothetical protein